MAIGANAAATGQRPKIFSQCELGNTLDLNIGGFAMNMGGVAGTTNPAVMFRAAVAGCHNGRSSKTTLDLLQQGNELWWETSYLHILALEEETMIAAPGQIGHRGHFDGFVEFFRLVLGYDSEQRLAIDAGKA